jgi:hypothetical protein
VESSRGADQTGSFSPKSNNPSSFQQSGTVIPNGPVDTIIEEQRPSQQEVQVHTPPGATGATRPRCVNSNTGLSQSDLSISSSNGSNQNYNYGSQETYNVETKGYCGSSPVQRTRIISSNSVNEMKPLMEQTSPDIDPNRPIITAAIFKGESQDSSQDPVKDAFVEGGAPLSSDIQAFNNNNDGEEKVVPQKVPTKLTNGIVENGIVENGGAETLDSLSFLPAPPTSDEIKQYNDLNSLDMNAMDSLPPPSPPNELNNDVVAAPTTTMPAAATIGTIMAANGVLES